MVKFSVIVPVYNVEKYIKKNISSVLSQSYRDLELICLDDGSTDKSVDIIKQISNKDDRLKLIENKLNVGPGKLRNQGLKIASGEWILFLDSDDWYEKDLLKKLNDVVMDFPSLNVIEFRFSLAKNEKDKVVAGYLDRGKEGIKFIEKEDIMLSTGSCNKCWKRQFLIHNRLHFSETNRSGEEITLHICGYLIAKNFYYLDYLGHNWRILETSLSHDVCKDETFLNGIWIMLADLKSELLRLNIYKQEDYIVYCATILNWHIKEKFNYSNVYKKYYNKTRLFMIENKEYLRQYKSFRKIIKSPYWLMILNKRIKDYKQKFFTVSKKH